MLREADAVEGPDAPARAIELRPARVPARRELALPDEEDFVDRAEAVDLELVVGVAAGDEQLDVVVLVDRGVALGQRRFDERLLDPVPDVEVAVVPEHRGTGIVDPRATADEIGEAGRAFRGPPVRLVQPAVDDEGRRGTPGRITGDAILRPGERPRLGE